MHKVLVTGGSGFIGSEIVKQLHEEGSYEITVLDALTEQVHGEDWKNSYLYQTIMNKCNFIKADIRDISAVRLAVADSEYIIHLAAETGTGQSMYQINQYNEVNVMGTSNLFQAISDLKAKSKVKKIILSSSRSVYGEGKYNCSKCGIIYPKARNKERMMNGDFDLYCDFCGAKLNVVPTTEDSPIYPNSLYAFTKYAQEKMLHTMCPALDIDYTIFRYQNVYGIGQSLKNPYTGILSIFSTLMLEDKDINIFENGMESRDFINVKDIALGTIKALDISESNSEIINLGSGEHTRVIDIANILKNAYLSTSKINITGDFRIGDIAHNVADIQKAKNIIGFHQTVSLEAGLKDFCEWVMGQDKDNSEYERALNEMEHARMFVKRDR